MTRADPAEGEFVAFVTDCWPSLRRHGHALTGDWHLAEDLLQIALIKVYGRWSRIQPSGRLAYTRQVMLRAFLDRERRRSSRERSESDLGDRTGPVDEMAEADARDAVRQALLQLPPGIRAVLVCRFLEDLDVATTARLLGVTQGTVKSQTARGLQALRGPLVRAMTAEDRDRVKEES